MRPEIVLFGDSLTAQSFGSGGWGAALADTYSRKADVLVRGYGGYNTRWALFLLHHIFPLKLALLGHCFICSQETLDPGFSGSKSTCLHQNASLLEAQLTGCPRSRGFQPCFHPKNTPKAPIVVTIFFGANDAAILGRTSERQHVPLEEYKDNLKKMVNHLKEYSPTSLVILITPPPVDEEGRNEYARSLYGDKARELPERTNEVTGLYAKQCLELAKEMGLHVIDLWSKLQETEGWQKKFLRDGLHFTPEGNGVLHQELEKVLNETSVSASKMPLDFPHHSKIDGKHPEKAFQYLSL
ncbi:GDSL esterase/lipase At5g62930 isoform X1 [Benincasa hispida]|uniref:GDSL esterase/lipase At5g62930 isoform X1 n=1 Tax=Benincasa hispida TaxID=102211 RepID=UPI0018FF9AC3|nr:GDSL esterase/lipase At5g62930 isoform X1 [Benincasa hispida]